MEYSCHPVELDFKPVFSILVPTWNNLDYLQCLLDSIYTNSIFKHQIIVHINEGTDGTLAWIQSRQISYTYSSKNSGVCLAFNLASQLVSAQYLVLMDDDLFLCPAWDQFLMDEIKKMPDEKWCMSSTMIEPVNKRLPGIIGGKNYGLHPSAFDAKKFLSDYQTFPKNDWNGSQWYPLVLPTLVYRAVGGLSIEFSPGMYSDPDFMIKLWQYGIRYYKGISKSRAYHFGSRTTQRVQQNDGRSEFILKWGLSSNTFFKRYLRLGHDFLGYLPDPAETYTLKLIKWIDRWKVKFKTKPVKFW